MTAKRGWTCDVCGQPIRGATGYVTIGDRDGGHPVPRVPRKEPRPSPGLKSLAERIALGELELRVNVKFAVMHADCDPDPNSNEYWFGVERARTQSEWLAWANHLGGKSWMGKRELLAFLAFWFSNRGIDDWRCLP